MRTTRSRAQWALMLLSITVVVPWSLAQRQEPVHNKSALQEAVLDLDQLVQQKRYSELKRQLREAKVTPVERDYFEAIRDDRCNHPSQAASKLETVLPELRKTSSHRAAIAIHTLAYDYFKLGRYADASDALADVVKHFAGEFSAAANENNENDRITFVLLRSALPQTVSGERNFKVLVQRDAIRDVDVPVRVRGTTQWWIFDTGANITTISSSSARQMALTVSKSQAATQSGATGRKVSFSTAVIPELQFGGAEVRNVVALVLDDKELDIDLGANGHYRIQGILGYPVLAALGCFTVSDDEMTVTPECQVSSRSASLYVEELTPLIEVTLDGRELLFQFDTGQANAELSANYVRAFPQQFSSLKSADAVIAGAGGSRSVPVYSLPRLSVQVGGAKVLLTNITALTQDRGVDPLDELFGNMGQGLLRQFRSYQIDFAHMRLTLGDAVRETGELQYPPRTRGPKI